MVIKIIMPKMGQTMEKGKIVKWLKKEGERIEKGEPLLEIETDKTTIEIESRGSGILRKILSREGEDVEITKIIAYIAEEGETLSDELDQEEKSSESLQKTERPRRIKASPVAKKMAIEKGLDLSKIEGTGPGGRITRKNIIAYLKNKKSAGTTTSKASISEEQPDLKIVPLSGMRKAIALNMTRSKMTIPHFYITMEVDMTHAVEMRQNLIPTMESRNKVRLSLTHMIVKAVAMAIEEFPQINARFEEESITIFRDINIGIAVGLDDGLIVPVLKNANKLDLTQIATEVTKLVSKAKDKRLGEKEFSGGTITISNLGAFGVDTFTAIINPPEASILAIGKISDKPSVINGRIMIRKIMKATLSADHRSIDGTAAAKFLGRIKTILEAPHNLLLQ